jgi:magnesium-dependent phosphatase 1
MNEPGLLVFDLDFTLWDAGGTWCDHTDPPYAHGSDGVTDGAGRLIRLYPQVTEILGHFREGGSPMALASRTHAPDVARTLLHMFDLSDCFQFAEIYPGSKIRHFQSLHQQTGIPFEDMYFFDDEQRNIRETSGLGVNGALVDDGLEWKHVRKLGLLSLG